MIHERINQWVTYCGVCRVFLFPVSDSDSLAAFIPGWATLWLQFFNTWDNYRFYSSLRNKATSPHHGTGSPSGLQHLTLIYYPPRFLFPHLSLFTHTALPRAPSPFSPSPPLLTFSSPSSPPLHTLLLLLLSSFSPLPLLPANRKPSCSLTGSEAMCKLCCFKYPWLFLLLFFHSRSFSGVDVRTGEEERVTVFNSVFAKDR